MPFTQQLDGIGFIWNPLEHEWNVMFDLLLTYKEENNHDEPQASFKTLEGHALGLWCNTQRTAKKKNSLSPEKI